MKNNPVSKDEVLKNVKVPLAGDLLGRERVTGAKKTRLGCDSPVDCFTSIIECPALWHCKMAFLSVLINSVYMHINFYFSVFKPGHAIVPISLQ